MAGIAAKQWQQLQPLLLIKATDDFSVRGNTDLVALTAEISCKCRNNSNRTLMIRQEITEILG